MTTTKANLLNSITLIVIGLWGYFDVDSPTALIPVFFGVILFLCNNGVKNENKVIAHVAVLLTLLLLIALVGMRLPKSIDSGGIGLYRVLAMILTSTLAMVAFIRNFINARKKS
ncbi:MAG: TMEM14 family protein [Flavobacteriales bacterium]|jgi:uncharacterized membrane protein (UPF0136 family)|nr:TMEM14 family protein [Flavobacteriales bacterium]